MPNILFWGNTVGKEWYLIQSAFFLRDQAHLQISDGGKRKADWLVSFDLHLSWSRWRGLQPRTANRSKQTKTPRKGCSVLAKGSETGSRPSHPLTASEPAQPTAGCPQGLGRTSRAPPNTRVPPAPGTSARTHPHQMAAGSPTLLGRFP